MTQRRWVALAIIAAVTLSAFAAVAAWERFSAGPSSNLSIGVDFSSMSSAGNISTAHSTPGVPVLLTAAISGGDAPYTASWSFGDGTESSGLSVTHVYPDQGCFLGSLEVYDATGHEATASFAYNSTSDTFSSSSGGNASGTLPSYLPVC